MANTEDQTIQYFRDKSEQIDKLYGQGKTAEGQELLLKTLAEARTQDEAYALFFEGEVEGYLNKDRTKQFEKFTAAVDLRKDDFLLFRNLGNCLSFLGREDDAIAQYDKALELNPEDYDSWRQKGVSLSELGKQKEAIALYDKALELNPEDWNSWRNKGVALAKLGQEEEAIALFDKALELNPQDYRSWRGKGVSLFKLGQEGEAIAQFDKALELNPHDHNSWRNKGVSLSKLGQEEEAMALFDKALDLNPEDYDSWRQKGVSLSRLGQQEEAMALFDKALALNPEDYDSWRQKGVSLSELGQEEEAMALYDKALALNPEDYDSWRQKGVSLSKLGQEEEAMALFDKALDLNPEDYDSWRQKGVSLSRLGQQEEAMALFDKALALNPEDYNSWRQKGVSLSELGQEEEAMALYDKALELNPDDYNSWRNKGVSLSKLGQEEEAMALYDKALELNPKDLLSYHGKSVANYRLGNVAEAGRLARQGLEIEEDDENLKKLVAFLRGVQKKRPDQKESKGQPIEHTQGVVDAVRESMRDSFQGFLYEMEKTKAQMDGFINDDRKARTDVALFHVLRKWNSYTPILPANDSERSVGGGYFLQSFGTGIVIDPGFGFIENFHNAGFKLADIDVIMVTHAHNDHNSDLESLLTLFYTRNKNKTAKTTMDLYLNTGAFQKFSGLINLRSMTYLNRMHTLMPGHEYRINEHTSLKALDAYHDEVITKSYAVGLWFTVNQGDEERNIIISSDTSLFPPGKDDETVDPDPEKEIWKTYGLDRRKINLLIPHLGSIKEREFIGGYEKPEKVFYPNHLGILGTAVLITHIKPELAVISEFGEELRIIQENLVKLIEKVVDQTTKGKVKLLPGDKEFIYDVINKKVCCQYSREMVPYDKIKYGCLPEGQFAYYCDEPGIDPLKTETKVKEFKDERKKGNLKFCHK